MPRIGELLATPVPTSSFEVRTSAFTPVSGKIYAVNTSGGAFSVTLPTGVVGDLIGFEDAAGSYPSSPTGFGVSPLTINPPVGGKIQSASDVAGQVALQENESVFFRCIEPGNWRIESALAQQNNGIAQAQIPWGVPEIQLSNNGSDTAAINFSSGVVVVADTNGKRMAISLPALTKTLNANWVSGNGGGLDTGSKSGSKWYHCWGIHDPLTGVSDLLFSLSAVSPQMPSGFTLKRRLGSVFLNPAATTIRPFLHSPGTQIFNYVNVIQDLSNVAISNLADVLYTFSVPTGIPVRVLGRSFAGFAANNSEIFIAIRTPGTTLDSAAHSGSCYLNQPAGYDIRPSASIQVPWITNSSAQLVLRRFGGEYIDANSRSGFALHGYQDFSVVEGK